MNVEQDYITVKIQNGVGHAVNCPVGTLVRLLLDEIGCEQNEQTYLGALVNNDLVSLSYRLEVDSRVKLLQLQDIGGWRIYRSSVSFLLAKAARELFPDAEVRIEHSLDTGFYCTFEQDGQVAITREQLQAIEEQMIDYVRRKLPIERRKIYFEDAVRHFERRNQRDKVNLLRFRNPPKVVVHQCEDFIDLAHIPLADNTECLHPFKLTPYESGFVLQFADRDTQSDVQPFARQPQLFRVFQHHKQWGKMIGVRTAGDLNELIMSGDADSYIKTEEAFQEKQLSRIADEIALHKGQKRWVLIAGPSSSGKTTFAKRLRIALRVNGISTEVISVDNYFVERDHTPRDENGQFDFEHIEALDLDLFHEHIDRLDSGESVQMPTYDFQSGSRIFKGNTLQIHPEQMVIVEGIHSLNPRLTESLDDTKKFLIYISALTQLSLDLNNRISTTDNRLIRRMVRDHQFRGHSALRTLEMWESVRKGEQRWIFPYQGKADVAFSSALGYELAVLKPFAEPLLAEVKPYHPQYANARRVQSFLKSFIGCPAAQVPRTSLLCEFIGKSSY